MLVPEISVAHETFLWGKSPELEDLISHKNIFSKETHHDSCELEDIVDRHLSSIKSQSIDFN